MTACIVSGVDLATLGLVVDGVQGLHAWPSRSTPVAAMPGWDGARVTSADRPASERQIRITGLIDGRAGLATTITRIDALAQLLEGGRLEVEFPTVRAGILYEAVLDGSRDLQPPAPVLVQPWVRVAFTLRCPDPYGYEASPVLYTAAAATRLACPVRTARCLPLVTVVGPYTNPIIIHRHGDGTELGRVTITDTAADATTHLRLLTDAGGEIWKLTSSTTERDDDLANAGWWVPILLPEYAIPGADQTLEVSSGQLQVTYRKAIR